MPAGNVQPKGYPLSIRTAAGEYVACQVLEQR